MKKISCIVWAIALLIILYADAKTGLSYISNPDGIKLLHVGFHTGCLKDFEDVVQSLAAKGFNIDLTSWNIAAMTPRTNFDGSTKGNAIWNISRKRADAVWFRHKDFFEQFDIIMTSDTAPLSRIFLQDNHWKKPLIIWVCNRFDYVDAPTRDSTFPDREYYQLFQEAVHRQNVHIIPYTDYEWYYAERKGLNIGRRTIRPIGSMDDSYRIGQASLIPDTINPEKTLFIYPRLDQRQMNFAKGVCDSLGINAYSGKYNGPGELATYKAVLYFPYAWSNLALYENLNRGIIHLVPSIKFVKELLSKHKPIRTYTTNLFELGEWYKDEYKNVIIYFDSWEDLKEKFEGIDYASMQEKIKAFGMRHRTQVLAKWESIFEEFEGFVTY